MKKPFVTKDSGKREKHQTGAVRDTREGKGRYDLMSIFALKRYAEIMERGAAKYSNRNWEKGMPISRFLDSALRHIFQHLEGLKDEDHIGQAMWNLAGIIHMEELIERGLLPQHLNDLPDYKGKPDKH